MQQALALFPGLHVMTDEERKYSNGRIRNGEGPQFLTLIAIIEAFPKFFEGLADLDEGVDPTQVETPLMRDRVQRAEMLAKLIDDAAKLGAISDTVLHLRELVRDPMKEAYAISKVKARGSRPAWSAQSRPTMPTLQGARRSRNASAPPTLVSGPSPKSMVPWN